MHNVVLLLLMLLWVCVRIARQAELLLDGFKGVELPVMVPLALETRLVGLQELLALLRLEVVKDEHWVEALKGGPGPLAA